MNGSRSVIHQSFYSLWREALCLIKYSLLPYPIPVWVTLTHLQSCSPYANIQHHQSYWGVTAHPEVQCQGERMVTADDDKIMSQRMSYECVSDSAQRKSSVLRGCLGDFKLNWTILNVKIPSIPLKCAETTESVVWSVDFHVLSIPASTNGMSLGCG